MTRMIRAVRLTGHGVAPRIEQVPLREPGPGEVVVEMSAGGVNPLDRYGAEGLVAANGPLPRTLGIEGSGWLDGAPVLVNGAGLGMATDGTWAQAVVVDREEVTPLALATDMTAAAGLGTAGITAWNTVTGVGKVTADDRVLVLGAGGGVGLSIVCLSVAAGASVVGQVGNAAKVSIVQTFGARAVVCDAASLADSVGDFSPTVTFDPLGGDFTPAALGLLALRGRHVIFGTSAGKQAELALQPIYRSSHSILGYGGLGLTRAEHRAGAEAAAAALGDGRLKIHVGRVIALSDAATVFDALSDRALTGKLIIDCTR